jgi:adenine-specific DNA-methyltransferase
VRALFFSVVKQRNYKGGGKGFMALQPKKTIVLDRLFDGNDELKTNIALQMRDAGVELRVV